MKTRLCTLAAALGFGFTALAASAQTKWDMPTGYPAANFHTENINQFAADVDKATGGKFKITPRPAGDPQGSRGTAVLDGDAQSLAGRIWRQIAAVLVRESGF